ncbi:aminoacyl tRNA synthase complex-interacting multifunctional protein 1 [Anabrus simplex]|uniref:aminoacyl tRNA synthase complex-interacting multifunctional protein 1 n=1 Tax=Anabrus simplex TaxID=316456 RepID=UPI0035A2B144
MAAAEILKRLETKAASAEELITELKNEVSQLKLLQVQHFGYVRMHQLEEENSRLKLEIEEWKNKLNSLEAASGIKQVPLPNQSSKAVVGQACGDHATVFNALFPKHEAIQKSLSPASPTAPSSVDEKKLAPSPAVEKKKKEKPQAAPSKKGSGTSEEPPVDVGRLDLRVGRITSVKKHPDADSLYVEEVDVGEEKPRTVVSGLVKHVSLEEMQDRMVIVLCNLKPAKMRGVTSEAMVMCASSPDKVEILSPPAGSVPGDEVHVEGYPRLSDPVLNPKKKVFETVAPDLKTNDSRVATYKGSAFSIPGKGVVTAPSLIGVNIK